MNNYICKFLIILFLIFFIIRYQLIDSWRRLLQSRFIATHLFIILVKHFFFITVIFGWYLLLWTSFRLWSSGFLFFMNNRFIYILYRGLNFWRYASNSTYGACLEVVVVYEAIIFVMWISPLKYHHFVDWSWPEYFLSEHND